MTPSTSSTATATIPATRWNACEPPLDAGAENVTLCDTNGSSLPEQIARGHRRRSSRRSARTRWRSGSTSTTTPSAASPTRLPRSARGARLVQGTVNGYGERCGNANLISILPALQLKMGFDVGQPLSSSRACAETAHFVDEICNITPDPDQPYVGRNAFAHKGGMHVAGVAADARTFEHIDPATVGNERAILAFRALRQGDDPKSGRAGRPASSTTKRPLARSSGSSSASIAATTTRPPRPPSSCCCDARPEPIEPLFELEGFRVLTEKRAGDASSDRGDDRSFGSTASATSRRPRATVRSTRWIGLCARAIVDRHPHLAEIELTNYKVRILDETHGTDAVTRVLLDSSDGEREWGTIRRI